MADDKEVTVTVKLLT